jgi:hypothetical protein
MLRLRQLTYSQLAQIVSAPARPRPQSAEEKAGSLYRNENLLAVKKLFSRG